MSCLIGYSTDPLDLRGKYRGTAALVSMLILATRLHDSPQCDIALACVSCSATVSVAAPATLAFSAGNKPFGTPRIGNAGDSDRFHDSGIH